jgi:hypothetical protein
LKNSVRASSGESDSSAVADATRSLFRIIV